MNYTKFCGCKIYVDESAIEIMKLEYCPKHKAAPDLYEALKGMIDYAGHGDINSDISSQAQRNRIILANKALAKAEVSHDKVGEKPTKT